LYRPPTLEKNKKKASPPKGVGKETDTATHCEEHNRKLCWAWKDKREVRTCADQREIRMRLDGEWGGGKKRRISSISKGNLSKGHTSDDHKAGGGARIHILEKGKEATSRRFCAKRRIQGPETIRGKKVQGHSL